MYVCVFDRLELTSTDVAEGRYIKGDPLKGYYDFIITGKSFCIVFIISFRDKYIFFILFQQKWKEHCALWRISNLEAISILYLKLHSHNEHV